MADTDNKVPLPEGLFFTLPPAEAPDFAKGRLSIKVIDFVKYLEANQNVAGYVNIDLLVSQGGKPYAKLNTWKPTTQGNVTQAPVPTTSAPAVEGIEYPDEQIETEDIPF